MAGAAIRKIGDEHGAAAASAGAAAAGTATRTATSASAAATADQRTGTADQRTRSAVSAAGLGELPSWFRLPHSQLLVVTLSGLTHLHR